jgi:hypothetical protein
MKTSDLKVGTDYAYEAWKRATPVRVTVLATGVTGVDDSGFGGSGRPTSGLVKVAHATGDSKGTEFNVRPATLKMTWSEHHGRQVSLGKHKAEQARQEQTERERRAALAFSMHHRLMAAGALASDVAVYDDQDREALLKAGFHPLPSVEYFFEASVFSAVTDLDDLMEDGTVALDDVAVLMGLEEPQVNEYSGLGSWDPEGFSKKDWARLEAAHAEASGLKGRVG